MIGEPLHAVSKKSASLGAARRNGEREREGVRNGRRREAARWDTAIAGARRLRGSNQVALLRSGVVVSLPRNENLPRRVIHPDPQRPTPGRFHVWFTSGSVREAKATLHSTRKLRGKMLTRNRVSDLHRGLF